MMKVVKEKWHNAGIEALICPPYNHCSFKAENAPDLSAMVDYPVIWNVLHYPAGIIPVTKV